MDAQGFSRLQILRHQLTGELEPGRALPADMLQQEAVAAEDAGAERLLKADAELDLRRGAEEAMPVHHVLLTGTDLDRHDVAGKLGGERQFSRRSHGADIPS